MMYPNAVLSRSVTAQPVTPASGDRYLIPVAATGTDWAGKDGKVGIYKGSRWFFAAIPVGRLLYVEDETAFYHRNVLGVWTAGVGSVAIGANSLNITNMLGAKASFVVKVENQTTNAPPASPVAPTAYIIGPSPTGAWAGLAGKLAICLTAGSFTIITPVTGDEVYDKARGANFRFNGTAWISSAGAWLDFVDGGFTQGTGSVTTGGSGFYAYSTSTAPTTTSLYVRDDAGVTFAARYVGQKLRIKWHGQITSISVNTTHVMGLFIDSNSTAIAWFTNPLNGNGRWTGSVEHIVTAADIASHTYRWIAFTVSNTSTIEHRRTTLEGSA